MKSFSPPAPRRTATTCHPSWRTGNTGVSARGYGFFFLFMLFFLFTPYPPYVCRVHSFHLLFSQPSRQHRHPDLSPHPSQPSTVDTSTRTHPPPTSTQGDRCRARDVFPLFFSLPLPMKLHRMSLTRGASMARRINRHTHTLTHTHTQTMTARAQNSAQNSRGTNHSFIQSVKQSIQTFSFIFSLLTGLGQRRPARPGKLRGFNPAVRGVQREAPGRVPIVRRPRRSHVG